MATFILLANYTDQGMRTVRESPKRLDAARDLASRLGVRIKDYYLCMGNHDIVVIVEAPNDEVMAKFALSVGAVGAVRTMTLKAFDEAQYRQIVADVA